MQAKPKDIAVMVLVGGGAVALSSYLYFWGSRFLNSKSKTNQISTSHHRQQEEHAEGAQSEWTVYHWSGTPGRSELLRLIFAETQTPFKEFVELVTPQEKAWTFLYNQVNPNPASRAIPLLGFNDLVLSHTVVCVQLLATKLDNGRLLPKDGEVSMLKAQVLLHWVNEVFEEVTKAWFPFEEPQAELTDEQKNQATTSIHEYVTKRAPLWLEFLENTLTDNVEKVLRSLNRWSGILTPLGEVEAHPEVQIHFIGNSLTYIDLCIFYLLVEHKKHSCPLLRIKQQRKGNLQLHDGFPLLEIFLQQVPQQLPRVKRWLQDEAARTKFGSEGPCC